MGCCRTCQSFTMSKQLNSFTHNTKQTNQISFFFSFFSFFALHLQSTISACSYLVLFVSYLFNSLLVGCTTLLVRACMRGDKQQQTSSNSPFPKNNEHILHDQFPTYVHFIPTYHHPYPALFSVSSPTS